MLAYRVKISKRPTVAPDNDTGSSSSSSSSSSEDVVFVVVEAIAGVNIERGLALIKGSPPVGTRTAASGRGSEKKKRTRERVVCEG